MQREMQRVYRAFQGDVRVQLLSHTLDPLPVLRAYAARLGVTDTRQWQFVRAPRDTIFQLARAYATVATADPTGPGGSVHDGTLAIIDGHGYLRGLYDGLNPQQTAGLLQDLQKLLEETSGKPPHPGAATAIKPPLPR
jgi:protein SCO1/2